MAVMIVTELTEVEDTGVLASDDLELERLITRLERGFEVLENARAAGRVVAEWDDEWIRVLRRYEFLMDQRAA